MSGRRMAAPCGHEGEAVIGTFVLCLSGCDKPKAAPAAAIGEMLDRVTAPSPQVPVKHCPSCGAHSTAVHPIHADLRTCRPCGYNWRPRPALAPACACPHCGSGNTTPWNAAGPSRSWACYDCAGLW